LYLYNYFDIFIFNLLIFIIVIFDTSSYLIGKVFGRNKIFKKISPNKTLEGYIGGVLSTNTICLIILLLNFSILNIHHFILINLIVIFSIIGDLIQSFFKRKNLIKDSSNFLPGHGGFFDRFDSFISSIMLLNLYNYLYL
jgi:phosphatidate cytidylyltransferase